MISRTPPPFAVSAAGSSVSSGTVAFSNSNNVTFGMSGGTVTGSASFAQTNPAFSAQGGSSTFQTLSFSNANGISFSNNAGQVVGSYTVPTVPTAYVSSVNARSGAVSFDVGSSLSSSGNGSTTTFGLASNITTALQSAGNYLTTARASNDAIGLNTAQTNVTWTVNSSGLSLNAGGYAGTGTSVTGGAALTLNSNGLQFNGASLAGTTTGFTGANASASMTHNTAGLALSLSVNAGGAFSAGVSTGGNTSGDTGVTGSRLVFAGGNNVTLSQATDANGATVTISGANAGGAQTGISGVALSNTTYTSGTISFRDLNGISWGTTTGQAVQVTHDLQYTSNTSNITSNALNTSASRVINIVAATNNTGGGTASLSSNVSFSNANGATFYTSAGGAVALSYSVPTVANSSWTVSDAATSATVGRLAFTNANGLTLSLSTSNNGNHTVVGSYTVPSTAGLLSAVNVSAGTTSTNASAFTFANGNGVSFGLDGRTVTGSVNTSYRASNDAVGLNTAKTNVTWTVNSSGISLDAGGYAGTVTGITGGIGLTANTSGVSVSIPAYLTTARGSTDAVGLNTAQTNVTWTVNSSGLSLNAGGYAGTGFTSTTTAGTAVVATNNTAGLSMGVPAYLTTADLSANSSNYLRNWKLTGNTAGTTSSQQGTDFWLAGGNGITVSGSSNTISLSVGNYLTTARASTDAIGLNTAQSNVTWTVNSSGLSLDARGYAGTGTSATNASVTINSNGLAISVGAGGAFSAGVSTGGNTSGDTGVTGSRLVFAGNNNITLSQATDANGATITISGATVAGQPVNFSAGTTSGNLGSVVFSNSNLVSFGLNGSTITGSVPGTSSLSATGVFSISSNGATISMGVGPMSAYAVGVTTQSSSGTWDARSLSFRGAGGVSVGVSNGSVVVSGCYPELTYIPYFPASTSSQTNGAMGVTTASAWVFPISVCVPVQFNVLRILQSASFVSSTVSGQQSITSQYALYSNNAGTLSSISSGSMSFALTVSSVSATISFGTATATTGYGYGTVTASTTAQAHSLFGSVGNRIVGLQFGGSMSLDPGIYWLGVHQRQSSSSANVGISTALVGNAFGPIQSVAPFGSASSALTTNTSYHWGWGVFTSTGSAGHSGTNLPASMAFSGIANTVAVMPMVTFISTS